MTYSIIHVVRDWLKGDLKKVSDDIAESRMEVCLECEAHDDLLNVCTACGCYLPMKTKLAKASCPMEKW